MGAAGLQPGSEEPLVRVSRERLAEFDELMASGDIDAVLAALREGSRWQSSLTSE